MGAKVSRTIHLSQDTDDDLGCLAYNLKCNKVEIIKRLIEKGLDLGILEDQDNGEASQ